MIENRLHFNEIDGYSSIRRIILVDPMDLLCHKVNHFEASPDLWRFSTPAYIATGVSQVGWGNGFGSGYGQVGSSGSNLPRKISHFGQSKYVANSTTVRFRMRCNRFPLENQGPHIQNGGVPEVMMSTRCSKKKYP